MLKLTDNLYSVGVQDPNLRTFDIIMNTPFGTTYNAYVLKGSEKTALIEAAKDGFQDQFFKNVEEVTSFDKIDYLIINHTEPDHAGIIPLVLEKNPNIVVVGTNSAVTFVSNIIKRDFNSRVVKKGDTLDLGDRQLQFFPMPNLHWPDTMFTWDPKDKTLFTCDFFGAHYAFPELLLSRLKDEEDYHQALYQYFLDIMAPFRKPFATNGLKCAQELNPDMICTGHGPILDCELDQMYQRYAQWCETPPHKEKTVAVVYVSAYTYTKSLAQTIVNTLKEEGLRAEMMDPTREDMGEIIKAISYSDGVLFGSPTFLGDMLKPVGEVLTALYPFMVSGKPASAFGSYGWSGEAVPNITERLKQLKMKVMDGYRVRLKPDAEELHQAEEFARAFAKTLS